MTYSPDGAILAIGSETGVYLYDAQTLQQSSYYATTHVVSALAFSPDGQSLAVGATDWVEVLRTADGQRSLALPQGEGGTVTYLAFSPDGDTLATAWDRLVTPATPTAASAFRLWRAADGQLLRSIDCPARWVAISPDWSTIATGYGRSIELWAVGDGKRLRAWEVTGSDGVIKLAFSPDSAFLAYGQAGGGMGLHKVSDGTPVQKQYNQGFGLGMGHTGPVRGLAFSPDGAKLVSGGEEVRVRLWSLNGPGLIEIQAGHWVRHLLFSPDGRTIAGLFVDAVRFWSAQDGALLATLGDFRQNTMGPNSHALSADGETLAIGARDGTVTLWRVMEGSLLHAIPPKEERLGFQLMAFLPDGSLVAVKYFSRTTRADTIEFWRVADGSLVNRLETPVNNVTDLAMSPDSRSIAIGRQDGSIDVLSAVDGSAIATLSTEDIPIYKLLYSPDSSTLVSRLGDDSVRLWDVESGALRSSLAGTVGASPTYVHDLVFSPDGSTIAGAGPRALQLWSVDDGRLLWSAAWDPQDRNGLLAFSTDGSQIAVRYKSSVQFWSARDGSPVRAPQGADGQPLPLGALSADWSVLAEESAGVIRLLSTEDGSLLAALQGHTRFAKIAFSEDGRCIVSESQDGTVRVWGLP
jgi:WD40 repeat protein